MTSTPDHRNPSEQAWCRVDQVDSRTVVSAGGRFDTHHYTKLHDALTVSAQVSGRLVLDLTQVESMEPTAFGMLIGDLQRLRDDNGATVSLVGPTAEVASSLDMTALERQFACYRTVGDAVAALVL